MTGRPTATERAAIKAGYAALLQSESPNSNMVETIVLGLGDRQMIMSPEAAEELRTLRERVARLTAQSELWKRGDLDTTTAMAGMDAELHGHPLPEPGQWDRERDAELRTLRARVAELETELRIGAPWTCPTCSKENTRDVCAVCETDRPETACGHGVDVRCEDCGRCHDCPDARCESCSICRCSCECAEREGEPAGSPAALVASRLVGMDDVKSVTVDDEATVTVQVTPRDLDGWRWWLGRFQVPVHTITCRGLVTTAKGTAPGGVTVLIVGHGIAALQAAAVSYITQRGDRP